MKINKEYIKQVIAQLRSPAHAFYKAVNSPNLGNEFLIQMLIQDVKTDAPLDPTSRKKLIEMGKGIAQLRNMLFDKAELFDEDDLEKVLLCNVDDVELDNWDKDMISEISIAFSKETQRLANLYIRRIKLMLGNDTTSKRIKRVEDECRIIEKRLKREKESLDFTDPEV